MTSAYLVHHIQGRVRIQIPSACSRPEFLEELADRWMSLQDIRSYRGNPNTGCVVLELARDWDESLVAELEQLGGVHILVDTEAYDPSECQRRSIMQSLRQATPPLASLGLVSLGLKQIQRGKALPAGLTLLMQGWEIARSWHPDQSA